MQEIICKNCGTNFIGKYCPNYSQAANEARFTLKVLVKELQSEFAPVKKGLFFTIKELALRPLQTIKNYLDGKRIAYLAPLKLLLTGVAAYIFVQLQTKVKQQPAITETDTISKTINNITDWLHNHQSFTTLAGLLPMAFFAWLFFRKFGYQLAEHIVIYFFISSIGMFYNIITLIVGVIFNFSFLGVDNNIAVYAQLLTGFYFYYRLMKPVSFGGALWRYTLATACSFVVLMIALLIVFFIIY